ncbi:DNA double-strand break repair nuclease NurA [filamentous cyanobacterium LEGE 11480]|uniref:DNA double-strand break repair nuclease NurA n=1 Tax=Romeriopsis navalis LEGE 11480 TaxID=2777977 RepID=A0A928VQR4_9CYAN|nr:DNA double-strand break repair nuclease NurA [Romeriopsis navalis]MBE9032063.1 DNA double-strand break repair nuclease NurA [Romeriopsis navalis LEGE 11480]
MPIKPSQIIKQLQDKREDFSNFDQETFQILELYRSALKTAMATPSAAIIQQLQDIRECGAIPLEPITQDQSWILPFQTDWRSREESLAWVRKLLLGISTFAVDGSQIYPGRDLSIPIALVQIGWFENLHVPDGEYVKDIAAEVMTPTELRSERGDMADRKVNLRRFEMEVNRIIQYFEDNQKSDTALAFFDGSLVASFAEAFDEKTRQVYVNAICKLLEASQYFRVPVVGYIDTTSARDLTAMLRQLHHLPEPGAIQDAQLLNKIDHREMAWGERTPIFCCRRSGILNEYTESSGAIAFTYLKTNRDSLPARLEMPIWMYEAGIADRIIDWVRGEVIIGSGYPYVLETADQVAVVQGKDRQAFYKLFQDWAQAEELKLRLSRKMVSKMRRR